VLVGVATVGTGSTADDLNLCGSASGCIDVNGVPTIVGATGQTVGTSQNSTAQDINCPCSDPQKYDDFCDFDNDGIPNYLDIDDDNDGILDVIENGCLYGGLTGVLTNANRSLSEAGNEPPTWFYPTNLASPNEPNMIQAFTVSAPTSVTLPLTQAVTNPIISISNSDYYKQVWTDQDGNPVTFLPIDVTGDTRISGDTIYDVDDCDVNSGNSAAGTFMAVGTFTSFTVQYITNPAPCSSNDGNAIGVFEQCTSSLDTDGDGIPNQFDLDSDGDGCSDAYEGNATTDPTVSTFSGPYGSNGYANSLETTVTYASGFSGPESTVDDTYDAFAIWSNVNKCGIDSDGDGIDDIVDLDDDNDGILDAVESPSCYMTAAEQPMTGDRTNVPGFSISSDIQWLSAHPLEYAINGINTTALNAGNDNGFAQLYNAEAFRLTFPNPVQLTSVNLFWGENNQTPFRGTFYVRGSNDGINWVTLSAPQTLVWNSPQDPVFTITQNAGNYKFYDLYSTQIDSWWPGNFEVTTTLNTTNYNPSAHPKAGVCTTDTDGDGIPNQLDLDSDGDGCSDAYEAGVTTQSGVTMLSGTAINGMPNTTSTITNAIVAGPYDANGFANSVETTLESGVYESTYTYSKAINSSIISCPVCTDPLKLDANCDFDGDGITNENDIDDDNDGITDVNEGTDDTDGDGLPDKFDLDSDNDGITDVIESGGSDPDNNGIIGTGLVPGDSDGDGLADVVDIDGSNTGTPNIDTDGDGIPNTQDLDADNDGLTDVVESGGTDANNDGIVDGTDPDHDGILSSADQDPTGYGDTGNTLNPTNTDGNGNPNYLDIDADDDGIVDNVEWQTTAGYIPPTGLDSDGDGIDNAYDQTNGFGDAGNTNTPTNTDGTDTPDYIDLNSDNTEQPDNIEAWDTNNNGIIDGSEPISGTTTDSDGDGLLDVYDNMNPSTNIPTDGQTPTGFPNLDGNTTERDWRESIDTDGDGIPNEVDLDDDNDGITDVIEGTDDTDGDGIPDSQDLDSDNDGITDVTESGGSDPDNNGIIGTGLVPGDSDGDGLADVVDIDGSNTGTPNIDTDGDGIPNTQDLDADNDGLTDVVESGGTDANNDGIVDGTDPDHDGILSSADQDPTGYGDTGNTLNPTNTDGNGNPNYLDIDADDDGIVDNVEWQTTAGYIPPTGLDSDGDGIDNAYDQTNGFGDAGNTNIPTNTDGTDTPDYIDLDSDNTEQPDNIEAWDTNNDGIINLGENVTGVSSTLDTDGDGLLDIYDNFTTTPKEGSGSIDITEGQTPTAFPNIDTGTTSEMDWRETMTPLPLELISFNGHKVNGGNQLNWVTKDEKDIEKFRLYRSFDGINYHLLTTEDSKAKHNNAGQELTYQFLDSRPNVGVNYYKLSAVEFNLTEEFFNVILLDNSIKGKKYTVRPTIVRTNVIVDINSFSQVQLSLYSLDGKLQFTTDLKADGNGNIQAVVNMTNLPSGLYLINGIDTVSGQRFTEKVIKE